MKTVLLAAAVATIASFGCFVTLAAAKTVPCEDKLVELRASMSSAKLGEAERKAVQDLEAKGVERCNADDDKRADAFFDDALKIINR